MIEAKKEIKRESIFKKNQFSLYIIITQIIFALFFQRHQNSIERIARFIPEIIDGHLLVQDFPKFKANTNRFLNCLLFCDKANVTT